MSTPNDTPNPDTPPTFQKTIVNPTVHETLDGMMLRQITSADFKAHLEKPNSKLPILTDREFRAELEKVNPDSPPADIDKLMSSAPIRRSITTGTSKMTTAEPTKNHGRRLNVSHPKRMADPVENSIAARYHTASIGGVDAEDFPQPVRRSRHATDNLAGTVRRPLPRLSSENRDRRASSALPWYQMFPAPVSTLQCLFLCRYHEPTLLGRPLANPASKRHARVQTN